MKNKKDSRKWHEEELKNALLNFDKLTKNEQKLRLRQLATFRAINGRDPA
ncbi:MAG: hypothetical protein ACRCXB_17875 [Aeromonadaceae bacterium]